VGCEKQWLESNRYYGELDESKLTSIFYFTLIWNLFESECCNKFARIDIHPQQLATKYSEGLDSSMMNEVWRHFQHRYIKKGKPSRLFKDFVFKSNDKKDWVEVVLKANDAASRQDKMEALLRIAFRLRNNLYHGEKDVRKLYEQNENFRQINRLLMALIEAKQGRRV